MLAWSSCIICYSVIAVELSLVWNNIDGVYEVSSTGQFIPLLIGALSFGRAVVSACMIDPVPARKVCSRK